MISYRDLLLMLNKQPLLNNYSLLISLASDTTCMSIKEAVDFYSDDLPNSGILDEELPLSSKVRPLFLGDSTLTFDVFRQNSD